MATLWPERCKGIVSVSGYLDQSARKATRWRLATRGAAFLFWYQYYFTTPVGKAGYEKYL